MNRKIKYLLAATAAVFGALIITGSAVTDFRIGKNMEMLVNLFREINFFYVDPVDPDKLMTDAAYGMTSSLDPYTEFFTEQEMTDFEIATTGKYGGIGSLIRKKGEWVVIAQPYKNFPADRAGLVVGDTILSIDGRDARGHEPSWVSDNLRGDPGTAVTLTVGKYITGQREKITLRRERIVISGVPYHGFIEDGIGYIQHSDFTENCSDDLLAAFMEMRQTGELKGLILDYRGNGGGILQEAVKILSYFLPKDTEVVSMKGKMPEMSAEFHTSNEPVDSDIPIVLLVNGGSASASEIVSGAMQDLDRAVLIGQRTLGKGLVQATRPVGYNAYIKMTTAKYYIPSGRCIQAIDYARRDEQGAVSYVPDSLVREYFTAAGRKVYDGAGIMPDLRTDPEYVSRFTLVIYAKGYIDDFVDEYVRIRQPEVDPIDFRFSDEDYAQFVEFMQDKDIEYQSETKAALQVLRQKAERERYADRIQEDLDDIERRLKDDLNGNLALYKDQITEIIEGDIILRNYYADGVVRYKIGRDDEVALAVEILRDGERYRRILSSQDTDRK